MYCINCGKKLDDNVNQKFCPFCGYQIAGKEKEVLSEIVEKEDIKKAVQETIKESMAEAVKEKGKINYQPIELIMMLGIALATALLFSKWINVDVGMLRNFSLSDIPGVGWLFGLGYTNKISILSLIALSGELGLNGSDKFMIFAYIISVLLAAISLISFWSRGKAFYFSAIVFSIMMCVTSLAGLFLIKYSNALVNALISRLTGVNIGSALFGDVFTANVFLFIEFGIGIAGIIVGIHTYRINKDRFSREKKEEMNENLIKICSVLLCIYTAPITLIMTLGVCFSIFDSTPITQQYLQEISTGATIMIAGIIQTVISVLGFKMKNLNKLLYYSKRISVLFIFVTMMFCIIANIWGVKQPNLQHMFTSFLMLAPFTCFPIILYTLLLHQFLKRNKCRQPVDTR